MNECIFCSIAMKSIKSRIVYEDENTLAFLDITPRSKGMCLVIPKKHLVNFTDDLELSKKVFETALIVSEKIQKSLEPLAVFMSALPSQVPHVHLRVYPVYENQIPLIENKPIETNEMEMDEVARKIRDAEVKHEKIEEKREEKIEKKEEKIEEKPVVKDGTWIKRYFDVA